MSTKTSDDLRGERIHANCKKIWGSHSSYDVDIETDDYEFYICYVRRDYGDCIGSPLLLATSSKGADAAWTELDKMLDFGARKAEAEGQVEKKDKGGVEKIHEGQVEEKNKGQE